jgi:hypothetical protein
MKDQRYYTGEEIHLGDRVTFGGCASTIVFVVDRDEFPNSETAEARDWWRTEHGSGFMVHQDAGADIFLDEADEDLLYVSRAAPSND